MLIDPDRPGRGRPRPTRPGSARPRRRRPETGRVAVSRRPGASADRLRVRRPGVRRHASNSAISCDDARARAARSAGSGRAGGPAPGGSRCSGRPTKIGRLADLGQLLEPLVDVPREHERQPQGVGPPGSTAFAILARPAGRRPAGSPASRPAPAARLTIRTPPSWRSPWTVPTSTVRRARGWPAGPGRAAGRAGSSRMPVAQSLLEDVALAAEPALADLDQGRLDHPLDQLDRRRAARPAGRAAPRPPACRRRSRRSTSLAPQATSPRPSRRPPSRRSSRPAR